MTDNDKTNEPNMNPDGGIRRSGAAEPTDAETEGHGFKRGATEDPSMNPDEGRRLPATEDPESNDTEGHDRK